MFNHFFNSLLRVFWEKNTFSINFSKKKFSHAFTYSIIKYIYYYIWYSIRAIFLNLST